ncbi:hypothetical protein H2198_003005 [Neophaeococcomyces mojaviensis]|uniref:Uncharacterized protein n=1 Tax=Neophaeococcomyces mojaviensis TaxID=3383035 RepID=A0ACC3ACG2_9EURO|nr:hypothetical protein H2198_003005 [Knufia sp. JES_112]
MTSTKEPTLRTGIYPAIDPKLLDGCLQGKVALVTGSSRGIGKAIATALASVGASVAINGRAGSIVEATVKDIQQQALGAKVIGVVADVLNPPDQERMLAEVQAELGKIDILVLNAGTNLFQPFHQTKASEWWDQMNLNIRAPVELTRMLIPQFMTRNSGCIIYTSSRAAVNHFPFTSAYSISKGGITQFASCLQAELDIVQTHPKAGAFEKNGIEVFSIHPGEIATELHKVALPPNLDRDAPYIVEMRDKMKSVLPRFQAELPAWTTVFLASGRAHALRGRYVDCTRDIAEVIQSVEAGGQS